MAFQSLSVIVPVVTETESFIETVETIVKTCNKKDLKEIIICNTSYATSECKKIVDDLFEKYRDVPVRILTQQGSFEDVIKDLFSAVSGSHFIFQPADLEIDPKMLRIFIDETKNNPDSIITGSRFLMKEHSRNYSHIKKIVFVFFRRFFQIMYSQKLTDTTFMYQVIPTERVDNLVLNEKSYSVLYEAFLKILRTGVNVVEVPVEFKNRPTGKSKVRFLKDGWRYVWVFFRVRLTNKDKFYKKTDADVNQ